MSRFYVKIGFLLAYVLLLTSGCMILPQNPNYEGPAPRPPSLDQYYDHSVSFDSFDDRIVKVRRAYTIRDITLKTLYGPVVVRYFQRPKLSPNLVFVFPILGGKNTIEEYFAEHFAENGFDTVIINRNSDFKKPENFKRMEEIFRTTVIRDRITLDFFEQVLGKKSFGSFGLSRGAINVSMLAGVDARMRFNVLVMGASSVVEVFKHSTQPGLQKYKKKVLAMHNLTEAQFFEHLEKTIVTDPQTVAKHINARETLLFLSVFDTTVPFSYGLKLRRELGYPETVFLLSNHYTSILYTQFVKVFAPLEHFCLVPLDYVESETLRFFQTHFNAPRKLKPRDVPLAVFKAPFALIGRAIGMVGNLFSEDPFPNQPRPSTLEENTRPVDLPGGIP